MEKDELMEVCARLRGARQTLQEVRETAFEGINVNVRRALLAIDQALFNACEEGRGGAASRGPFGM